MLLVFLSLAVALVYGVLKVLKSQIEQESKSQDPPIAGQSGAVETGGIAAIGESDDVPGPQAVKTAVDAIPTPLPPQVELEMRSVRDPPPVPEGLDAKSPGMEALAVLEAFLNAKSLDERLPIIETKSSPEEISASCLKDALPPRRNVVIDAQESNPVEGVIDYYYNVDFEAENNRLNPQTLLVRTRGSSPPKVVIDPFLDLYGGRLAAYAAAPQEKGGQFQVIVYPVPSCSNERVRDREKKRTLKLLARVNNKEIAEAYFSKASKIGEMLVDGTYNLSFGTPKACTVMLRWNTEENQDYPYLEAIGIKRMDWNP